MSGLTGLRGLSGLVGGSASFSDVTGVILNGLVSEYRLDEGTGTRATDVINGYNLTLGSSLSDKPDWVSTGLDFVPANGDVLVNSTMPDSVLTGALTVTFVANLDTGGTYHMFLGKSLGNGAWYSPLEFRTSNAGTPALNTVRANGVGYKAHGGPNTTIGSWKMYTVVFADGNLTTAPTFYVGSTATPGTAIDGSGTGNAAGDGRNLRIGRRDDGAVQLDGKIAYIGIYNAALTADAISFNYAALQTYLSARSISL